MGFSAFQGLQNWSLSNKGNLVSYPGQPSEKSFFLPSCRGYCQRDLSLTKNAYKLWYLFIKDILIRTYFIFLWEQYLQGDYCLLPTIQSTKLTTNPTSFQLMHKSLCFPTPKETLVKRGSLTKIDIFRIKYSNYTIMPSFFYNSWWFIAIMNANYQFNTFRIGSSLKRTTEYN